jgi:hypothetical protein
VKIGDGALAWNALPYAAATPAQLAAETTARVAADAALASDIAAEAAARQALATGLATETSARVAADAGLASDIAAEAAARQALVTGLATGDSLSAAVISSKLADALIAELTRRWPLNDGTMHFATTRTDAGVFTAKTSTGYARLINPDGTLGVQAGTGAPGNNITLTIPAGSGLRAMGILSVSNGGGTRSGNITSLEILSRQIVAFSVGSMTGLSSVNCADNSGLTSLPNWANVSFVECSNCPGLATLPNWANVSFVACPNCPGLTTLPNWANVSFVGCYNCPGLTTLPNWANVNNVSCYNCPGLTSLPNWANVNTVNCSDNPCLTSLPNWAWPNTGENNLYASNCPGLTSAFIDSWFNAYAVTRPAYLYVDITGSTGDPTAASAAVRADLVSIGWTLIF